MNLSVSAESILKKLNLTRSKSEKEMNQMITQHNVCREIREMIVNTFDLSKKQLDAQKYIIEELSLENKTIKKENSRLKNEIKKTKKTLKKKENLFFSQIKNQQEVIKFFNNILRS